MYVFIYVWCIMYVAYRIVPLLPYHYDRRQRVEKCLSHNIIEECARMHARNY